MSLEKKKLEVFRWRPRSRWGGNKEEDWKSLRFQPVKSALFLVVEALITGQLITRGGRAGLASQFASR